MNRSLVASYILNIHMRYAKNTLKEKEVSEDNFNKLVAIHEIFPVNYNFICALGLGGTAI